MHIALRQIYILILTQLLLYAVNLNLALNIANEDIAISCSGVKNYLHEYLYAWDMN